MTKSTLRAGAFLDAITTTPQVIVSARDRAEVELSLHGLAAMASKDFTDAAGMGWRVWNTVPISGAVINPGFEKGWLTFESDGGSLRRLAPIPTGWYELAPDRLIDLLRNASEVPRHTGPMRRAVRPDAAADSSDRG